MSFEWRTEEEDEPQDRLWPGMPVQTRPSPWRRRLLFLLLSVLLLVGAFLVRRQLQEQVVEVEAAETEALLTSVRLAQQAAAKRDQELLKTVLSGRDPQWLAEQYQLLSSGLLLQEAGQTLGLFPQAADATVQDIIFDSALREAEVVAASTYTTTVGTGQTITVTLAQASLYRRGGERWLLSPPTEEFWGEESSLRRRYLSLSYPARDRDLVLRLARDLDDIMVDFCSSSEVRCPQEFHLRIRLERTLDSLQEIQAQEIYRGNNGDVDLPAPTLIGLPQDETSYQTLLRAYAVPVVEAAVAELVNYDCCAHVLLYRALLDWQLSELGLRPWPQGPAEYMLAADYLERPGQLQALWEIDRLEAATPVEREQAYAAVELLAVEGSSVPFRRTLADSENMAAWVRGSGEYTSLTQFMHRLRRFLFARIEAARSAPPPPDENLLLVCGEGARESFLRYDLAEDTWQRIEGDYDLVIVRSGPVLFGNDLATDTLSVQIWDNGRTIEVSPEGAEQDFFFLPVPLWEREMADPAGQYLPVVIGPSRGWLGTALVDLDHCRETGCSWFPVSTFPRWSPDGSQLLLEDGGVIWRQTRDSLGDGKGRQIGPGIFAFWLGTDRYGYLRDSELVIATVGTDVPETWVSLVTLLEEIGEFEPDDLVDIMGAPGSTPAVALFLDAPRRRKSAVVYVSQAGPAVEIEVKPVLMEESGHRIFGPPLSAFSPDGRWLVLHTSSAIGGERGEFLLYNLVTGARVVQALAPWWVQPGFMPAQQFAWSQDGRWLARVATHQVDLLAPTENGVYRRYLIPPYDSPHRVDCETVGWLNGVR